MTVDGIRYDRRTDLSTGNVQLRGNLPGIFRGQLVAIGLRMADATDRHHIYGEIR
jgi:hypothetical protein